MQTRNVPVAGPRYWAAITVASVFGANMGDFFSHILGLGHWHGLAPLALLFAVILLAERRAGFATQAFYWLGIVTLRTAATNLGDLLTHDFKLPYPLAMGALALLLTGIVAAERLAARQERGATAVGIGFMPPTTLFYWATMLTAGTLGTDAGDYVADVLGLGVGAGSVALGLVLALVLAGNARFGRASVAGFWLAIVAVRSFGTTLGDWCAGRHGLALGLPLSTTCTGIALVALLLLWRPAARDRMQPSAA